MFLENFHPSWFPRKLIRSAFGFACLQLSIRIMRKSAQTTSKIMQHANSSRESLAFNKTTDPAKIYFPKQDVYYVYRPAKPDANILLRCKTFLSLYYYKYLLHSGLYVMTRSEQFIINSFVVTGIILSCYQGYLIIKSILIN